jgi:pimeloyl-ACP methyl ester carboxylesterase
MEMFNDLRSDPEIQDNYQFWFYLYPTGQPFWFSAAQMREDMAHVRDVLDPNLQDASLDQMVLVGHSMGGLVSKLQTVNSGEDFWRTISDKPPAALNADPTTANTLAKTLFFRPNSSVRRVITIGTPHRGSEFANDTTRWLSRRLINISNRFVNGRQRLLKDNPDYFREDAILSIDTSIDSLAPDSPFLPVLLTAQKGPWISYHNIVGQIPSEGIIWRLTGDGDGVVPLSSARLNPEEIQSQVVVPADHSNVHRHPLAIREVRRILLEHLNGLRNYQPRPIAQLGGAVPFGPPLPTISQ